MPVVVAGIEPRLHGFRRAGCRFFEGDDRLLGGPQALVGDREESPVEMPFVLAEDLNDVAVRLRIGQLEYVRSRWQHLAWNFDRTAEREDRLLVPFASGCERNHPAEESQGH